MTHVLKPHPPPLLAADAGDRIVLAGAAKERGGLQQPTFARNRALGGFDLLLQEVRKSVAAHPAASGCVDAGTAAAGAGAPATARPVLSDVSNLAGRRLPRYEGAPQPAPLSSRPSLAVPPSCPPPAAVRASHHAPPSPSYMSPQATVDQHGSDLTTYEKTEIRNYDEIYYYGQGARKIHAASVAGTNNHGFDDERNDYKVIPDDHITYRYQVLHELGRGSFGQVSKAMDHKTKEFVALKVIKNKKKFHEQAQVEIRVLRHLRDRDLGKSHAIKLIDDFVFRGHTILVFELEGMSLYDHMKSLRFAPLPQPTVKMFLKQILQCLAVTHQERIVHCDLKPENVLLKTGSKMQIKVIDFGSACFESQKLYTYIQSRFYRAPEIILGIPYTTAIDVWSLGCMACEFCNGYPIFPGENEAEQIQCIMEFLGVPPRALIDRAPKKKNFFDTNGVPRVTPNSRGKTHRPSTKSVTAFLKCPDPLLADLVLGMLTWEPEQRMTPAEALRHAYFAEPVVASVPSSYGGGPTSSSSSALAELEALLPKLPGAQRRYPPTKVTTRQHSPA